MIKKFPNSALVIVDNKTLLFHTLNYLYKFNFKNITLLKKKNLTLNTELLKKYSFQFNIKTYNEKKFSYDILNKKNFLRKFDKSFLLLKTSKFTNLNLFNLYKIFSNNTKKLVITISKKNKEIFNSEIFFIKKKLINSYDFSFNEVFYNSNYKLNFIEDEYINLKTIKLQKKKNN